MNTQKYMDRRQQAHRGRAEAGPGLRGSISSSLGFSPRFKLSIMNLVVVRSRFSIMNLVFEIRKQK